MFKDKRLLIYKISLISASILISLLLIKYLPKIIEATVSINKFSEYIMSLGKLGSITFIFFQILQTVVAPIPGEVIQIAGGYIYGVSLGAIYTTIGLLLGAIIAFYFTRFLGGSFIGKMVKKKRNNWISDIMNSKKFSVILFIIFIVPGLPKDFLIYVAGLTSIKPIKFFAILLVSRFPWILASVSIGSNLHYGNYISTGIVAIIATVTFILGIVYKDKLINKFSEKNSI